MVTTPRYSPEEQISDGDADWIDAELMNLDAIRWKGRAMQLRTAPQEKSHGGKPRPILRKSGV